MISLPRWRRSAALSLALLLAVWAFASSRAAAEDRAPTGRAVIAWHVTIAPSWFDPSTAPPQITPFGMLYAIHDALVRPYPGREDGTQPRRSRGARAKTASSMNSGCVRT